VRGVEHQLRWRPRSLESGEEVLKVREAAELVVATGSSRRETSVVSATCFDGVGQVVERIRACGRRSTEDDGEHHPAESDQEQGDTELVQLVVGRASCVVNCSAARSARAPVASSPPGW